MPSSISQIAENGEEVEGEEELELEKKGDRVSMQLSPGQENGREWWEGREADDNVLTETLGVPEENCDDSDEGCSHHGNVSGIEVEEDVPLANPDEENDGRSFSRIALDRMREDIYDCLLYTSPSPRDGLLSRMPSSA